MFPTHVGIARRTARAVLFGCHVPYACGDCAVHIVAGLRPGLCSLRMWGLREVATGNEGRHWMFPTHVGIARHSTLAYEVATDVPYACGDCAKRGCGFVSARICSLRMWGLRASGAYGAMGGEMFPTHVGIARGRGLGATGGSYVPYACGDCAQSSRPLAVGLGCSLRMWGLRARCAGRRRYAGMFPTHVGIARSRSLARL